MQSLRPAARGSTKLLALLLAAGLLGALTPGSAGAENKRVITVMTRNLYLGTDLDPIIGAPDLPSLLQAVDDGFANVVATDFPTRAGAIADEIADTQPDLVGLQEVSLWRTDVPPDGEVSPAETVAFDFLQILLGAMEARGLSYAPVVSVDNFDAEVPAGFPPTMDVRLTDRDVILARTDLKTAELMLSNPMAANFETAATIPDTPIGTITIPRGWTSVDVKLRGKEFRLVNTHLEVASFPLGLAQVAQGFELLAGPASTDLPVVLVGDLNSAADGSTTPTYQNMLGIGLFDDAWTDARPGEDGFTCCQDGDLLNEASLLDERIDLVLHRGGFETLDADLVGEEPVDKVGDLWPSDHAGVVATLRLG